MQDGSEFPVWINLVGDSLVITPMIADIGCVTLIAKATDVLGETATSTFNICVEGYPTAAIDVKASIFDVQMYPNPAKGEVNLNLIASKTMDSEVIVRSITGSEVLKKEFKATEQIKIDLSDQVTGIYLVTLKTAEKSVVKKLILDRK